MQGQLTSLANRISTGESSTALSMEKGGELELPVLPSTYFDCQKGLGESVDRAETFSQSSKTWFQQWAKGTEICLAEAQIKKPPPTLTAAPTPKNKPQQPPRSLHPVSLGFPPARS